MKIGFLLPSVFASSSLYPNRIFAPKELAQNTINELVLLGHEVIVFSTPDFESKGKLMPGNLDYMQKHLPYYKLRNDSGISREVRTDEVIKRNFEISLTAESYQYALHKGLDIIHAYHDFVFSPHYFSLVSDIPTVYTLHDPLPPANTFEFEEFSKFALDNYVSISNSQRRSSLKLNFVDTVYHGIIVDQFPFQKEASDYVLFMGRLVPEKGLHNAIATSLSLGIRLEVGTELPNEKDENAYFKEKIKPFLSEALIEEPGIVSGEDKMVLYGGAQALLFPIEWEEPFGIVMIEAMACGTPVVAFNRGSVAEVIKDGVTGFIVDQDDTDRPGKGSWQIKEKGVAGLIMAMKQIHKIDRVACRKHIETYFTANIMARGYEKIYQKVLAETKDKKTTAYEGSSRSV